MFWSANVLNETECVANLTISEIHLIHCVYIKMFIKIDDTCSVYLRQIIDRPTIILPNINHSYHNQIQYWFKNSSATGYIRSCILL